MNAPNDPNSIMDWFKRHGMDGSYAARERLFREKCGLTGYRGTAEQNATLLRILKQCFGPQISIQQLNKFKYIQIITTNILIDSKLIF